MIIGIWLWATPFSILPYLGIWGRFAPGAEFNKNNHLRVKQLFNLILFGSQRDSWPLALSTTCPMMQTLNSSLEPSSFILTSFHFLLSFFTTRKSWNTSTNTNNSYELRPRRWMSLHCVATRSKTNPQPKFAFVKSVWLWRAFIFLPGLPTQWFHS